MMVLFLFWNKYYMSTMAWPRMTQGISTHTDTTLTKKTQNKTHSWELAFVLWTRFHGDEYWTPRAWLYCSQVSSHSTAMKNVSQLNNKKNLKTIKTNEEERKRNLRVVVAVVVVVGKTIEQRSVGGGSKWSTTYRQIVMLHCYYHAELPRSTRMSPETKDHREITILNTDRI